ncbi:MAG: hypothetical protein NTU49_10830, partial [Gammaproteobacteria bacterium]|nr:hypothetical protein [Gammaproteobacteria bacterium]
MSNLNLKLATALAVFLGVSFGFMLCINNIYVFIMVFFLPSIWLGFPNRWIAALFMACFYLCVSWEIVPDLLNYQKWNWTIGVSAIGIWCIGASIMTIPWLMCYPLKIIRCNEERNTAKAVLLSLFFLSLLLTIPPFGVLCWSVP